MESLRGSERSQSGRSHGTEPIQGYCVAIQKNRSHGNGCNKQYRPYQLEDAIVYDDYIALVHMEKGHPGYTCGCWRLAS
jgi:hypothetical protein